MVNKIACLIITYNRKELLKRCLSYVYKQTFSEFDIIVVNNGSSDGTSEYLYNEKVKFDAEYNNREFQIIEIKENDGPANAFYLGKEYVFSNDYDWAWIMDDDGYPDRMELEELIKASNETGLLHLNALVCKENEHDKLCFPLPYGIRYSRKKAEEYKYIYGIVHQYNGTFINKSIYDNCGNINKKMRMHLIEVDYMQRVLQKGYTIATVTKAIHMHPLQTNRNIRIIKSIERFKIKKINVNNEHDRLFIINSAYVDKRYFGYKGILKSIIKYTLFYIFNFKFKDLPLFLKYYIKGLNTKY